LTLDDFGTHLNEVTLVLDTVFGPQLGAHHETVVVLVITCEKIQIKLVLHLVVTH
jgi:hypothetical protein